MVKNLLLASFLMPLVLLGHGAKKHTESNSSVVLVVEEEPKDNNKTDALKSINKAYLKDIKPIFKVKCFDCHGSIESFPWYYKVPGIKQLMDWDMEESKEHLDMRKDFPFVSHETPLNDLKSLKEVIEEDEMPPIQYILGHWDSYLTEDEKKQLFSWVDSSIKKLGDKK